MFDDIFALFVYTLFSSYCTLLLLFFFFFFFNDPATTEFYTYSHTLPLPDALPCLVGHLGIDRLPRRACLGGTVLGDFDRLLEPRRDRLGHVVAPFAEADVEILHVWRDVAPHLPGDRVDHVGDHRFGRAGAVVAAAPCHLVALGLRRRIENAIIVGAHDPNIGVGGDQASAAALLHVGVLGARSE